MTVYSEKLRGARTLTKADTIDTVGDRIDALLGINIYAPRGALKGLRFVAEGGLPVYENLQGPQLSTSFLITTGLSYTF